MSVFFCTFAPLFDFEEQNMRKLFIFFAAYMIAASAMAQNEFGIIAGGINGFSYKHWFSEKGAIQTDLAVGLTAAPMGVYAGGTKIISATNAQYDFTINPNLLGHLSIGPMFQLYGGAGINLGMVSDLNNTNPNLIMGKVGANAVLGTAINISVLVIALDFRPGYGLGFRADSNALAHFFDWKLGLALRYRF